jgi:shikimate kinase
LRVSLVGVSCVGTTTIGRILADRRGCPFFDLDEEVERHFGLSIERLQARFLTGYSYRKECAVVLEHIATANPDCVIALPPSGLRDAFLRVLWRVPGVTVAVHDTPENILERITFYDTDSRRTDKHLTAEERILYLKDITADISYSSAPMSGRTCTSPSPAWTRRPAPQPSTPGWAVPERASKSAPGLGSLRWYISRPRSVAGRRRRNPGAPPGRRRRWRSASRRSWTGCSRPVTIRSSGSPRWRST